MKKEKITHKDLWNKAIQLLARREYALAELSKKLQVMAGDLDVEPVLEELVSAGYQSDQRFTESFVRMRAGQGHGLIRIRFDLKQKGISSELIEETVEQMEIDWFSSALNLYERKYRNQLLVTDLKEKNKRMRYMSQRGFSMDEIQFALENCVES